MGVRERNQQDTMSEFGDRETMAFTKETKKTLPLLQTKKKAAFT